MNTKILAKKFRDAWEEQKHPRGGNSKNAGQFSKGSGSGGAKAKKPAAKPRRSAKVGEVGESSAPVVEPKAKKGQEPHWPQSMKAKPSRRREGAEPQETPRSILEALKAKQKGVLPAKEFVSQIVAEARARGVKMPKPASMVKLVEAFKKHASEHQLGEIADVVLERQKAQPKTKAESKKTSGLTDVDHEVLFREMEHASGGMFQTAMSISREDAIKAGPQFRYLLQQIRNLGAKRGYELHGKEGDVVKFDAKLFDPADFDGGVRPGDDIVIVDPPVIIKKPSGEHKVVALGTAEKRQ